MNSGDFQNSAHDKHNGAPDLGSIDAASDLAPPGSASAMASGFHADAFQPFDLGGKGQGFGVFDQYGSPASKYFATKGAAQSFADDMRAALGITPGQPRPRISPSASSFATSFTAPASTQSRQASSPTGSIGTSGLDLDDNLKASVQQFGTSASTATGAFGSLSSSAADLAHEFADAAKFMASSVSGQGTSTGSGIGAPGSASVSPFAAGSQGFQAAVKGFASAFRQSFQSPTGDIPVGGQLAGIGAGAGGFAASALGAIQGIGSGATGKARRAARGFARSALKRARGLANARFRPSYGGASSLGRAASAGVSGFANGVTALAGIGGPEVQGATAAIAAMGKGAADAAIGLASLVPQMRQFSEGILEQNQAFARLNSPIALAFAKNDFGDFKRDSQTGSEIQVTAKALAGAVGAMRDNLRGFDSATQDFQNMLGTAAASFASGFGASVSPLAQGLVGQAKGLDPEGTLLSALPAAIGSALAEVIPTAISVAYEKFWGDKNLIPFLLQNMNANIQNATNAATEAAKRSQMNWGGAAAGSIANFPKGPVRGHKRMPR